MRTWTTSLVSLALLAGAAAQAQDRWLTPAATAVHASGALADVLSSRGMRERGTCEANPLFRGPDCTALLGRMALVKGGIAGGVGLAKWQLARYAKGRSGQDRAAILWLVRGLNVLDLGMGTVQWGQAGANWRFHRERER